MMNDPFGFKFWLLWILSFVGALLIAAIFWTVVISALFGKIQEPELLVTWCISVFGCWFLLLTPFMRKKEQIWKRLNNDQEKAVSVWLAAMGIFLGLIILSSLFWDWRFRKEILSDPGFHPSWVRAVISSWLLLILPFLIFLYKKADQIYKAAVARQTQWGPKFQTLFMEKEKRILPARIAEQVKQYPETMNGAHVLELTFKDGKKLSHVFVLRGEEILGVYDRTDVTFNAAEVVEAQPVTSLLNYEESKWVRLDGRA